MDRVYRAKDEETFLILKKVSDSNTPVVDSNKYKIIALENEAPDFIKTKRVWLGESYGNAPITDPVSGVVTHAGTAITNSATPAVTVPCAELFDDAEFLPGLDKFKIRINKSIWTTYHELPLDEIEEQLSLTFVMDSPTGGKRYSQEYDVADFTLIETTSSPPTVSHYNIVLEKAIEQRDSWIEANPNAPYNQVYDSTTGTWSGTNDILEPTLGLRVYKYKIGRAHV